MIQRPHDLPHRSHSRRASLCTLTSSASCSAVYRGAKTIFNRFCLAHRLFALRTHNLEGRGARSPTETKKKKLKPPNGDLSSFGCGDGILVREGYLLFVGRTRRMTQYAATAVAGIDPDGTLSLWHECSGHRAQLVRLKSHSTPFFPRQKRRLVERRVFGCGDGI